MKILVVAATKTEIQPAIDFVQRATNTHPQHNIACLISGIGGVSTAYALTRHIHVDRPDIILQAGIAGCFGHGETGKVFTVTDDRFADIGVWENGDLKTVFDLQLAIADEAPYSSGKLINPHFNLLELVKLTGVSAVSVNEITTSSERLNWYSHHWMPVLESMEGAAFHYVCLQESIPFLQIRSVSNDIGQRDKKKWNIPLAIKNLNSALIALLRHLLIHTKI